MSKSKNIAAALLLLFASATGNGPQTFSNYSPISVPTSVTQEA